MSDDLKVTVAAKAFMHALDHPPVLLQHIEIAVPNVWAYHMPGLGVILIAKRDDEWAALYSPTPGDEQERKVIVENFPDLDYVVIVPMLHKRDRLDVYFYPPKEAE